jgi:hypothetical protein
MNQLERYLQLIVEPTYEEFRRNPTSVRHAYLACVATFHAIDRVTYPRSAARRRGEWRKESIDFAVVDHVAHDFKHVKSDRRQYPPNTLLLSHAIYGHMGFNTHTLNDTGQVATLRNIVYAVRDAIRFVRRKGGLGPSPLI